ncbi:N-formylglutamate amidohydrolase [Ancylobacter sp. WKF20]|jgi:N-formylglutamate amidohydrolase|uniref:N-formylglutamate amidohydrolase n=1 Tax=Ancylobacter sp. WKF20 TaxID=3039801 RepID=UPI002434190A|nr:N-formylglutamate amidohydrolase [Ancylobacter sp. WKF20]WGD28430.1 N-formylglutamate amidohydrolase [Ancylobacter sp. WKF20]
MMAVIAETIDPAFEVVMPAQPALPFLFNSPHSGIVYPRAFVEQSRLDLPLLRRSEDTLVDALFADVTQLGMAFMRAHFPRCYLDVNREPYELDPRMFEGRLPAYANTRSMRVSGGLGTIARIVGEAQEIYARRIPIDDAIARIDTLYKPYHRTLRQIMTQLQRSFGMAVLVDCHSMPSGCQREDHSRIDMVIGDRYGTSCAPVIAEVLENELRRRGYSVVRNKPYAGGFITEHYGNPASGVHAVQIEINRALYMHEPTYRASDAFETVRTDLIEVAAALGKIAQVELTASRAAAE